MSSDIKVNSWQLIMDYLPAWNPQKKTDNVGVELVSVLLRKAL